MFRLDLAAVHEEPPSDDHTGSFSGSVFQNQRCIGSYQFVLHCRNRLAEVSITFQEDVKKPDDFFRIDLHRNLDIEAFQKDPKTLLRLIKIRVLSPEWRLPGTSRQGFQYAFEHVNTFHK
ncbi:hypothetical protein CHL76_09000 [Marinococcus halophilus]|uniref:Uncharacterized protein n=1 Tax=Marinococcus halophilus TaxID=1371 RepID=A0A510Y4M4_MARHA|nr:hypothetical protein [Marinococcus halophilus]OZT80233.1 hypothetical protein CHL76_09000 [Marinococcus halophilus]GEK58289.1 hypothetical protein MHA01_11940 [Marinococcus halophilus]